MRFVAATLVGLASSVVGCLQPNLVECGDKLCSRDQICFEDRCVDPDHIDDPVCGDGVVDVGEDCDGGSAGSCLDYGFDMGNTGCSEACRVDLNEGCVRFGWRQVVNAPVEKMWANANRMLYTTKFPDALEIHGLGGDAVIPGSFQVLAGNRMRAYVTQNGELFEVVGATLMPVALPTNAYVMDLVVADDDTVYARFQGYCGLWMLDGAWKEVTYPSALECLTDIAATNDRVFTTSKDRSIYELTNGELLFRYTHGSDVNDILYDGDALWIAADNGLYTWRTGTPGTLRRPGSFTSLARARNRTYAAGGTGLVERLTRSSRDTLRAPSQGAVFSEGSTLYVYGGPIYAFSGTDFTEKVAIPNTMSVNTPMVDVGRFADGTVVAAADQDIFRDDDTVWTVIGNPGAPANIAALAIGNNQVVVSTNFQGGFEMMLESDRTMSAWTEMESPERMAVDGAWIADDGTLFAVGRELKLNLTEPDRAAFAVRTGGVWKVVIAPEIGCHADAVHRDPTGRVVAAGACGDHGVIWQRDVAGEWVEVYRSPGAMPFVAVLAVGDGGTFATGDAGTVRGDGTTWIVDEEIHGRSLSGTGGDVWLAGYFTNVQRFDGTTWSQVTTQALTTMLVSVGDDDITLPGAASGRLRLVRDR